MFNLFKKNKHKENEIVELANFLISRGMSSQDAYKEAKKFWDTNYKKIKSKVNDVV